MVGFREDRGDSRCDVGSSTPLFSGFSVCPFWFLLAVWYKEQSRDHVLAFKGFVCFMMAWHISNELMTLTTFGACEGKR